MRRLRWHIVAQRRLCGGQPLLLHNRRAGAYKWPSCGHCGQMVVFSAGSHLSSIPPSPSTASPIPRAKPAGVNSLADISRVCAQLSKIRLSTLVVMTTSAGFLAAGGPMDWTVFGAAAGGTMLAAASANTFNQLIERENDRRMKRTFTRPLASQQITPGLALGWGITSAGLSCGVLGLGTTELTTMLGIGNIALYSLAYTLSKTRTEANTWVGALVGAVPPLMGWAAATGCDAVSLLSSPEPLLLASTLFLWQFPHFFALSWIHRKDYARGGFKMIPCADPTGERTADIIMRYSLYLAPLPLIASAGGITGSMFALEGTLLNGYLLYLAARFRRHRDDQEARRIFRCSLWYLPVLLAGFVFHSRSWQGVEGREGEFVRWVKGLGRKVCVHEVLVHDKKVQAGGLCPPVVAEKRVEQVVGTVVQAREIDKHR